MTSSRPPKMRRSDVMSSLECEMREANDDIIKNLRQEVIDLKARIDVQSEENRKKATESTQTCSSQNEQSISVEQHEKLQSELQNMKEKQNNEIQPLVENMKEKIEKLQEACEQSSKKQEEIKINDELIYELNEETSKLKEKVNIMKLYEAEKEEVVESRTRLEKQLAEKCEQLSLQTNDYANLNDKKCMLEETL